MIIYLSITTLCKFVFLNDLFVPITYMLKLPKAIRHHSRTKMIENPPVTHIPKEPFADVLQNTRS